MGGASAESAERGRSLPGARKAQVRSAKANDEQQAAQAGLDLLRVLGWLVLHDVAVAGRQAAADHVVVGPSGVYVVNNAPWPGAVTFRDGRMIAGGAPRSAEVDEVAEVADAIRGVLGSHPVAGVLCLVHSEPVTGVAGEVAVCSTENILDLLTQLPAVFDAATQQQVARVIGSALLPAVPRVVAPVEPIEVVPAAKHRNKSRRLLRRTPEETEVAPVVEALVARTPVPPPSSAVTPSAVTPSVVTPSVVTPSVVTPSVVTPSAVTQPVKAPPRPVEPVPDVAAQERAAVEERERRAAEKAASEKAAAEKAAAEKLAAEKQAAERQAAERRAAEERAAVEAERARVAAEREKIAEQREQAAAEQRQARDEHARIETERKKSAEEQARVAAERARVAEERRQAEKAQAQAVAERKRAIEERRQAEEARARAEREARRAARERAAAEKAAEKRIAADRSASARIEAARQAEAAVTNAQAIRRTDVVATPPPVPPAQPAKARRSGRGMLLALVSGLVVVLMVSGVPRVPDIVAWGKGLFMTDPAPAFGTTVALEASTFHPDLRLTAAQPVSTQPTKGTVARGAHLVAVPLTVHNAGISRWSLPLSGRVVAIDSLGVEYQAARVSGVRAGKLLPGTVTLAGNGAASGMVAFSLPKGRTISEFRVALSADGSEKVAWASGS